MSHDNPHDRAADAVHEGRPVEAQYVRGGRKGTRILLVLIGGLAMVAIAYAIIYVFSAGSMDATNANDGGQAEDSAAFQTRRDEVPAADAPTTSTGQPTTPPTGEAPNVNAPTAPAQ